jgi:hypothetical protein
MCDWLACGGHTMLGTCGSGMRIIGIGGGSIASARGRWGSRIEGRQ